MSQVLSQSIAQQQQPLPSSIAVPPSNASLLALKSKVSEQLNEKGLLGRLRAELRANIYAILHETNASQGKPALIGENIKLNRLRTSREGRILLDMMAEFMEFFEMHQTLAVFNSECSLPERFDPKLRPVITKEIGLPITASTASSVMATAANGSEVVHSEEPLLLVLLRQFERSRASHMDLGGGSRRLANSTGSLSSNTNLSKSDPSLRIDVTTGKAAQQQSQPPSQQRKMILSDDVESMGNISPKRDNIDLLPDSPSPRQTQSPVAMDNAATSNGSNNVSPLHSPIVPSFRSTDMPAIEAPPTGTGMEKSSDPVAVQPRSSIDNQVSALLKNLPVVDNKKRGVLPPLVGGVGSPFPNNSTRSQLSPPPPPLPSDASLPATRRSIEDIHNSVGEVVVSGDEDDDIQLNFGETVAAGGGMNSIDLNVSLESISPPPQWQGSFNDGDTEKDILTTDRTLSADAINDIDEIPFDYEERVDNVEF